jgi:hypothetical protein
MALSLGSAVASEGVFGSTGVRIAIGGLAHDRPKPPAAIAARGFGFDERQN